MSSRTDPADWMWAHACDLIDQADRLHRQFFHLAFSERVPATWAPPVDVFEDEREVVIVVAMPGVPADRVQVTTEPGAVVVRGARRPPFGGTRRRVLQLEIPYGAFERRIPLPAEQLHLGSSELLQGCLILKLTKMVEPR